MSLTAPEQVDLRRAVHAPGDDLDCELRPGDAVDAAPADGEGAVAEDFLAEVNVVLEEEGRFLKNRGKVGINNDGSPNWP